jgi:uncharacterized membrane protein (UPF0127 family)
MVSLINARTEEIVASAVEVADTSAARRRGLLGRDAIDVASALVLTPCWAIHTAFMRFPIDVVFVNRDGLVRRVARQIAPWRVAIAPGAQAAIELAAGTAQARGVKVGDRLYVRSDGGFESAGSAFSSRTLRRMASKPACSGS